MPRTPHPLTVEPPRLISLKGRLVYGVGACCFESDADARAFVALPALEDRLGTLVRAWRAKADEYQSAAYGATTDQHEGAVRIAIVSREMKRMADQVEAALAQADGPAPTEE